TGHRLGLGARSATALQVGIVGPQAIGCAGQSHAALRIGRPDLRQQPALLITADDTEIGLAQAEAVGRDRGWCRRRRHALQYRRAVWPRDCAISTRGEKLRKAAPCVSAPAAR
ncbi:MAG TPA: hypothetical protein VFZ28_00670, partial [Burkholderiaceae bacterium]|nr:hypothetical protein [Burkholderiaceae bacterium]